MYTFDRDISFVLESSNIFKGEIAPRWSINGIPDGGYLAAILARAVLERSTKKSMAIFTVNFSTRCVPGRAMINTERFGISKQFERWQAVLSQGSDERARALGTLKDDLGEHEAKRYEKSAPEMRPRDECFAFPDLPQYTLFNQVDVRLDPRNAGWVTGQLSERSEQRGWFKFKDDRPCDIPAILLAADAFPPPVLASYGMIAWVPTIELSVNIRTRPTSTWLKCVFRSHFITSGIVEEDGEIWDENDVLIAVSRQISQFKLRG